MTLVLVNLLQMLHPARSHSVYVSQVLSPRPSGVHRARVGGTRHGVTSTYQSRPSSNATRVEDSVHARPARTHEAGSDDPRMSQGPEARTFDFGKWTWLSLLPERLEQESKVALFLANSAKLVDQPENQGDVLLWACLLNYRRRRYGLGGSLEILQGLLVRQIFLDVGGNDAEAFWKVLTYDVAEDDKLLDTAWQYAEWLLDAHGVPWPNLYESVLASLIDKGDLRHVLLWHLRLSPGFGLQATQFAEMFKLHITNPEHSVQGMLRYLYTCSTHRSLYDTLVPHLFAQGFGVLAQRWSHFLRDRGDHPRSGASGGFLQFQAAYYPRCEHDPKYGTHKELLGGGTTASRDAVLLDEPADDCEQDTNIWHMINRAHGQRFGIREKTYDDGLVARGFASPWISLDTAINTARLLGIDRIGPISLQAIALREQHAGRILYRIEQLRKAGISIGTAAYSRAVRHFAALDDNDKLLLLLKSDVHPEVFDDPEARQQVLRSAIAVENWELYHLMLSVSLAVAGEATASSSNELLLACYRADKHHFALKVLRDMKDRNIMLFPSVSHAISMDILEKFSVKGERRMHPSEARFYSSFHQVILKMKFPLATEAVRIILRGLGDNGLLTELESLCLGFIQHFHAVQKSEDAAYFIHQLDLPATWPGNRGEKKFGLVPRDLPVTNSHHPVQYLFDKCLKGSILRWGFRWTLMHPGSRTPRRRKPRSPANYGVARGIRLLALLREKGVYVHHSMTRRDARHQLWLLYVSERRLEATFLSRGELKELHRMRRHNRLSLKQAKEVCDEAWMSKLLPSLWELGYWVKDMTTPPQFTNESADTSRRRPWMLKKSKGEVDAQECLGGRDTIFGHVSA